VSKTDSFQKSFGNMLFVKQNYLIGREQKTEKKKHLFSRIPNLYLMLVVRQDKLKICDESRRNVKL
jgi:hypothetical protein